MRIKSFLILVLIFLSHSNVLYAANETSQVADAKVSNLPQNTTQEQVNNEAKDQLGPPPVSTPLQKRPDERNTAVIGFQKPATPIMHTLVNLHSILFGVMFIIFLGVCALLGFILYRFSEHRNKTPATFSHNTKLEVIWTGIPLIIVFFLAIFSLRALHQAETFHEPDITIKITGHQWYWNYEYPEMSIKFDSYMKKDEELAPTDRRLLSVDNAMYVPVGKNVRVIVSSDDVIHSWTIPAFGIKKDAVPGRLNETWFTAERTGVFYGQCSELCGVLHGFMPIEVHVVEEEEYNAWIGRAKSEFAA